MDVNGCALPYNLPCACLRVHVNPSDLCASACSSSRSSGSAALKLASLEALFGKLGAMVGEVAAGASGAAPAAASGKQPAFSAGR